MFSQNFERWCLTQQVWLYSKSYPTSSNIVCLNGPFKYIIYDYVNYIDICNCTSHDKEVVCLNIFKSFLKYIYEMKISISGFLHFLKIWSFPIIKIRTLLKNSDQKFVNFTFKVRFWDYLLANLLTFHRPATYAVWHSAIFRYVNTMAIIASSG
jgi:hypothetical protein